MTTIRTLLAAATVAAGAVPATPATHVSAAVPTAPVAAVSTVEPADVAAKVARAHPYAHPVRWDGRPFATPEAAMRFLVRAYNAHADAALRHVTTPEGRKELLGMRSFAPTLRLQSCTREVSGAYACDFWHSLARGDDYEGHAGFEVAPARRPGWYLTIVDECN